MIKFIMLVFCLVAIPVWANDPESIFQRAKQALVAGKEKEAQVLFQQLQALSLSQQQQQQIETFHSGHRLYLKKKLRLAEKLRNQGECQTAADLYQALSNHDATRRSALTGLQACGQPAVRPRSLRTFGLMQITSGFDDNPARVNQDLSSNKEKQASSGFQRFKVQLGLRADLNSSWSGVVGATLSEQDYWHDQADPYEPGYQQFNAQLNYRSAKRWQLSLPLRWRNNQYDGSAFNQWQSIGAQLHWRNRDWRQRFSLQGREYQYLQTSQKVFDGSEQRLAYTLSLYSGKQRLDAGLRWREREASSQVDYDHHQITGILRWRSDDHCWWQVCSYGLLTSHFYQRSYHASDPASQYFDRNYQGQSLAAKWRNRWSDWHMDIDGKWQKRHSNNDSYSYQRWLFDLALGYRF